MMGQKSLLYSYRLAANWKKNSDCCLKKEW
jgi:hypothetical protein